MAVDRGRRAAGSVAAVCGELHPGADRLDVGLFEEGRVGQRDDGLLKLASPARGVTIAFRAGCSARLVPPFSFRASFGLKPSEAQLAAWKRPTRRPGVSSGAEDVGPPPKRVARGSRRIAVGRVEGEFGPIDVDPQVPQVQRDALEDVGDRVRCRAVDFDFGGHRVEGQGLAGRRRCRRRRGRRPRG